MTTQTRQVLWRTITDTLKRRPLALRLAEKLGRGRGTFRWLDQLNPPPPAPFKPNLAHWQDYSLAAAWIGHATVLLRIGEMTVLTDPVLANRIGLGLMLATLGPRRHFTAALTARQLPPLDLILLSHAHFDHLDRQSLNQLPKKTPVVTAHRTSDLIRDLGFRRITELSWGQQTRIGALKLTARQVVHWGARTFVDQDRGYNAYLIEAGNRRVLFGGDSAYQEYFKDIPGVDLAILGIGAYDPYIRAHATPEQAWQMAQHMGARRVMAVHHSTFQLSHEPMHEPLQRILAAAGNDAERIVATQIGQIWADR